MSEQVDWVRLGESGSFEVSAVRLTLADRASALEALTLHDFELAYTGAAVSDVMAAWFAQLQEAADREARLAAARQASRAWSGPSRLERRIIKAYGLHNALWRQLAGVRPSAFSSEYRRRQRCRVKRRQR